MPYLKYSRGEGVIETPTLLEALKNARVFEITKDGENFHVGEMCDECFSLELSQQELIDLGNELIALANGEIL